MNDLLEQVAQPQDDSTRLIPLTQGQYAIVDATDFEWLNQWKWCATYSVTGNTFYAIRANRERRGSFIYMHRVITSPSTEMMVDHINGVTLDNRRCNLRVCTHQQNRCNQKLSSNNRTGYKGVYYYTRKKKYTATVNPNGKSIHLGYFITAIEAAKAYDAAAIKHFGEFARLNFPIH